MTKIKLGIPVSNDGDFLCRESGDLMTVPMAIGMGDFRACSRFRRLDAFVPWWQNKLQENSSSEDLEPSCLGRQQTCKGNFAFEEFLLCLRVSVAIFRSQENSSSEDLVPSCLGGKTNRKKNSSFEDLAPSCLGGEANRKKIVHPKTSCLGGKTNRKKSSFRAGIILISKTPHPPQTIYIL
jgi:hypothetical protein